MESSYIVRLSVVFGKRRPRSWQLGACELLQGQWLGVG
jgi:hypothetical protein